MVVASMWIATLTWICINPPGHASWYQFIPNITLAAVQTPQMKFKRLKPFVLAYGVVLVVYAFIMPQLSVSRMAESKQSRSIPERVRAAFYHQEIQLLPNKLGIWGKHGGSLQIAGRRLGGPTDSKSPGSDPRAEPKGDARTYRLLG